LPGPLVSVLVPVYQREALLPACLASALAQTCQDLEVVVVDNASTDGTWAVCQAFARRDPRVRAFRNQANLGPVRNWARCFAEARGRFGKVLFSDDLLAPGCLERLVGLLDDERVAFAFSAAQVAPEPWTGPAWYRWQGARGAYPSARFLDDALHHGAALVPSTPGAGLFRLADLREGLVERIPSPSFDDFAAHGAGPDLLLSLRAAARRPLVGFDPAPLSFFRIHPSSITMSGPAMVGERYRQARLHFAATHAGGAGLPRQVAREWWAAALFEGRREGTAAFAVRYLAAPPALGPLALAGHGAALLAGALRPRVLGPKVTAFRWLAALRRRDEAAGRAASGEEAP